MMTDWSRSNCIRCFILLGLAGLASCKDGSADGGRPAALQSLEIVDSSGRVRIGMGVAADGTAYLKMFDEKGEHRSRISVCADGAASVALTDGVRSRLALDVTPRGQAKLILMDTRGRPRIELVVSDPGSTYGLWLYRGVGQPACALVVSRGEGGPASLVLTGRSGIENLVGTGGEGDDGGTLTIKDKAGGTRLKIP